MYDIIGDAYIQLINLISFFKRLLLRCFAADVTIFIH